MVTTPDPEALSVHERLPTGTGGSSCVKLVLSLNIIQFTFGEISALCDGAVHGYYTLVE